MKWVRRLVCAPIRLYQKFISPCLGHNCRFVCMMISVPLHESAHALAASRLGDDTARRQGRLSLNPLAHFSPLGAVCFLLLGVGWATPVPVR